MGGGDPNPLLHTVTRDGVGVSIQGTKHQKCEMTAKHQLCKWG